MIYYLMFSMEEQREIIHHTKMRDCKVLEQVEAKSFLEAKQKLGYMLSTTQSLFLGNQTDEGLPKNE